MAELFDFDPLTGIRTTFEYDEPTGNVTLRRTADVEPLLDYTRRLASDTDKTKRGIRNSWWLYAKVPPIVELQLRQKGIRLTDPGATKRIIQEINENYPYLKCTQKQDSGKIAKIYIPPSVSDG